MLARNIWLFSLRMDSPIQYDVLFLLSYYVVDEILTRQYPCLGLLIHGAYVGAWRIRRLQTETGVHTNLPRFGPP
jgi:hypothetical protein